MHPCIHIMLIWMCARFACTQIGKGFALALGLTYLVYATWVWLGDEWNAQGRPSFAHWSHLKPALVQQ